MFKLLFFVLYVSITNANENGLWTLNKMTETITSNGYVAEQHNVTTSDGYNLGVFRIPYARHRTSGVANRPVVFLMHGIYNTSESFIGIGPEHSLAFYLADAGCDVWLGNARGNIYSRSHITLDPDSSRDRNKFFDFTYEQIGTHDLPAIIDYILNITKQERLHYIGFSQGGTAFLVMGSMIPEYNKKITSAYLLAGVGYMRYIEIDNEEFRFAITTVDIITQRAISARLIEFNPVRMMSTLTEEERSSIAKQCSKDMRIQIICHLNGIANYTQFERLNNYRVPLSGGGSIKQLAHVGQNLRDKAFRRYHYGTRRNPSHYNSTLPPNYNISLVTTEVTMFYALDDFLTDKRDVAAMVSDMPNAKMIEIGRSGFKHLDFMDALDAKALIYDVIVEDIQNRHGNNVQDFKSEVKPKHNNTITAQIQNDKRTIIENNTDPVTIEEETKKSEYTNNRTKVSIHTSKIDSKMNYDRVNITQYESTTNRNEMHATKIESTKAKNLVSTTKVEITRDNDVSSNEFESTTKETDVIAPRSESTSTNSQTIEVTTKDNQVIIPEFETTTKNSRVFNNELETITKNNPVFNAEFESTTKINQVSNIEFESTTKTAQASNTEFEPSNKINRDFNSELKSTTEGIVVPIDAIKLPINDNQESTTEVRLTTENYDDYEIFDNELATDDSQETEHDSTTNSMIETITSNGYLAEEHNVTTSDGYILGVFRIPFARNRTSGSALRPVVYLMHDLYQDSASFLEIGPDNSLGFTLADAGYDVWLGNARGNNYSRSHLTLDPDYYLDHNKFFDFTYEEIGTHDIPAAIDYILNVTKQESLHYIGFSQGGKAFLVMGSLKPEYNKKISTAHLLGGIGVQKFPEVDALTFFIQNVDVITERAIMVGMIEFNPVRVLSNIPEEALTMVDFLCSFDERLQFICNLNGIGDNEQSDPFSMYIKLVSGGGSIKQLAHYAQNIRDKAFRRYHYGTQRNMAYYNTTIPPIYDLSLIDTEVIMYYSLDDFLLDEEDVLEMSSAMPNAVTREVGREGFEHMDYVNAFDAKELVYYSIIDDINDKHQEFGNIENKVENNNNKKQSETMVFKTQTTTTNMGETSTSMNNPEKTEHKIKATGEMTNNNNRMQEESSINQHQVSNKRDESKTGRNKEFDEHEDIHIKTSSGKVTTGEGSFTLAKASAKSLANSQQVIEEITSHGYVAEHHQVVTSDGYILGVFRIPYARHRTSGDDNRPVVFLMHEIYNHSSNFIQLGPEYSLGYNLADAGYDVWLGNARGNIHSRSHITLDPDNERDHNKFFDFTYEEIGTHDLPATIDYILNVTKQESLHYVGYSQGGTAFLVMNSIIPEYNEKIASAHLMAGIGYMQHVPENDTLKFAMQTIDIITQRAIRAGLIELNIEEMMKKPAEEIEKIATQCSKDFRIQFICYLNGIGNYTKYERLEPYRDIFTGGGSIKQFSHYAQNARDKAFRRYHYGTRRNPGHYDSKVPPAYDLSLITTDVIMYYAQNDILLDTRDVLAMADVIPNAVAKEIPREDFEHRDYVDALDAKDLIYKDIIEDIAKIHLGKINKTSEPKTHKTYEKTVKQASTTNDNPDNTTNVESTTKPNRHQSRIQAALANRRNKAWNPNKYVLGAHRYSEEPNRATITFGNLHILCFAMCVCHTFSRL